MLKFGIISGFWLVNYASFYAFADFRIEMWNYIKYFKVEKYLILTFILNIA